MIINDWKPETQSLLRRLKEAGFAIIKGDNGEYCFNYETEAKFIEDLTACDESRLYVVNPEGKSRWLFLVYGNAPGELVCDYTCDEQLDSITDSHATLWEGRKQPTRVI